MKVVIIGGVAGGASAAARLRRLDEHADIVLLERGPYISFANCGLPYYIGGAIREQSALTLQTPESFCARFRVDTRVNTSATAIDPAARTVSVHEAHTGRTYTEQYDKLILAPGAAPLPLDIPGQGHEAVFTLRTIPDTLRMKAFLDARHPASAVVVGGGAIGLEVAENLVHAGVQVTLVELAEHVIASIDRDVAADVHAYLREKGVTLLLANGVTSIDGEGPLTVRLREGSVGADMVVLSAGIVPENALAKAAGLLLGPRGHIDVDAHMRTNDPDIYAVGDAVQVADWFTGKKQNFALAGPANRQGRIAADHICGLGSAYDGAQGSAIMKLFDMTVATTGLTERAARMHGLAYEKVHLYSASHATYYPGAQMMSIKLLFEQPSGRLLGGQFVGFEGVDKRCDVLATAIRANMTAVDLTRLELCYAPPFSSAKDPINMAGFMAENILTGKTDVVHWEALPALDRNGAVLLDVRTAEEYAHGHIAGARHIPLDELRAHVHTLPEGATFYVHCHSGLRSYIACRILAGHGRKGFNISGGWRLYSSMRADNAIEELRWE